MKKLPKAEEVLKESLGKIRFDLNGSITNSQLQEGMKEYTKRVLEYVAENVKTKFIENPCELCNGSVSKSGVCVRCDDYGIVRKLVIDKESIIKIKDQLS